MKNCAVAECGSRVRAIAMLPRRFSGRSWLRFDGVTGVFLLHVGIEAATLDHEARNHLWKMVPLKNPAST